MQASEEPPVGPHHLPHVRRAGSRRRLRRERGEVSEEWAHRASSASELTRPAIAEAAEKEGDMGARVKERNGETWSNYCHQSYKENSC